MSAKDSKSMDDVLASIRKIIKTDPNAVPPDASSLPPCMEVSDDTAKSVLDRLRKERGDDDDGPVQALSGTTDDPEATANAVLERLRQETLKAEKKAAKAEPESEPKPEPEPEPEPGPEPTEAGADSGGEAEEPLALGAVEGAQVLEPQAEDEHEAIDLPRPVPEPDLSPEPAMMIDEAMLESTIRRIVRDELTGEMGRRMTKNVQRMIEAEIKRFLEDKGRE